MINKASAILCADIHLRDSSPITRTDDYEAAQWKKLDFLSDLQKIHDCPVLCAGDLFDHWKPSPYLITKALQHLPEQFYTIYGDHDIPQRNISFIEKSGMHTLWKADKLTILKGGHGINKNSNKTAHNTPSMIIGGKKVFLWHVLTWKNELPFPDCTNNSAKQLLKKYPEYDLIVTGDNHKPFVEKHKGRLLVNTGSLMRMRADQIDYKPCVWLYYASTNTVEKVYLPIKKNVISREHIETKQQRNDRIDAFVFALNTKFKAALTFEDTMEKFLSVNKQEKKVVKLINKFV